MTVDKRRVLPACSTSQAVSSSGVPRVTACSFDVRGFRDRVGRGPMEWASCSPVHLPAEGGGSTRPLGNTDEREGPQWDLCQW